MASQQLIGFLACAFSAAINLNTSAIANFHSPLPGVWGVVHPEMETTIRIRMDSILTRGNPAVVRSP